MGIFWILRQISQIGLLVATRSRRHVLFSILLGVGWSVNVVFTRKIEREMAIFQAPMKKSNWCLCQFRLFFPNWPSQGATSGQIWSQQFHLAGNPGSFFACKLKKFFVYWDRSFISVPKFSFLGLPSVKISSVLDKTVRKCSRVPQVACCFRKLWIFYILFVIYDERFCALHISNFQKKSFQKLACGLENATFLYDVTVASTAYHDSPGPAKTGIAIVLTTLHVNKMFLQLDCTQFLVCQQNFLSNMEPVAYTNLKTFQPQLRLVGMHRGQIK